jgi:hypothetical protein
MLQNYMLSFLYAECRIFTGMLGVCLWGMLGSIEADVHYRFFGENGDESDDGFI